MNPQLHLPLRILIILTPPKHLQMIQNRTSPPTILFRKFHCRRSTKITLRRHTFELYWLLTHPISSRTRNRPIVPRISLPLTIPKRRHFMLIAQRTLNPMSVQIVPRSDMHQSNHIAAFDGSTHLTNFFSIVLFSHLPQAVGGPCVFDAGDELLAGA